MDVRRRVNYYRSTIRLTSDPGRGRRRDFRRILGEAVNDCEANTMAGIMVFSSIGEALQAGFQVYDRTSYGYLVRTRTAHGWELAVVNVISPES
jgi:hypothetical protein